MRNTTLKGDIGELKFSIEALNRAILCSKPISNSYPYDFITDFHGKLTRVQIKSSDNFKQRNKEYTINIKRSSRSISYRSSEVDLFAIHLPKLNTWYLIPSKELENKTCIALNPTVVNTTNKYEKYREAWDLLK